MSKCTNISCKKSRIDIKMWNLSIIVPMSLCSIGRLHRNMWIYWTSEQLTCTTWLLHSTYTTILSIWNRSGMRSKTRMMTKRGMIKRTEKIARAGMMTWTEIKTRTWMRTRRETMLRFAFNVGDGWLPL